MSNVSAVINDVCEPANDLGEKLIKLEYNWRVVSRPSDYKSMSSLIFSPSCIKQLKFYLTTIDYNDLAACSLYLLPCDMPAITIDYKVSWVGSRVQIASLSTRRIPSSEQITEYKLTNTKIEKIPHPDFVYPPNIRCAIELIIDMSQIPQPTLWNERPSLPGVSLPRSELVENLQQLFQTRQYSDIIINVGGVSNAQEFSAHKAILSMRSPVFSAMFEHEMSEKQENRVNVTDMEPEVFQEVLRFIYTDASASVEEMADELLVAADKYQISTLKAICEDALCAKVTIENAADTLKFADLHRADNLKKWTISFISRNLKEVIATPEFHSTNQSHPVLIAEALTAWAGK